MFSGPHAIAANYSFSKSPQAWQCYSVFELTVLIKRLLLKYVRLLSKEATPILVLVVFNLKGQ